MAAIALANQTGTNLYLPAAPFKEECMLFLHWSGSPQPSITVDQAWSSAFTGYFLFLNTMPAAPLQHFEKAVRAALVAPAATSFAWLVLQSGQIANASALQLGTARAVTADFTTPPTKPFPSIPVSTGTPVGTTTDTTGAIQGFTILYPPLDAFQGQPAAQLPTGIGLNLPMTGLGVGCIQFQGLMNAPKQTGAAVSKNLFNASLDPLNPFDNTRTFLRFTGISFHLSKLGDGSFFIEPEIARK